MRLEEGVPLACALVGATAKRLGIRALMIKGESGEFHRLRTDHRSIDADFLVEPGGVDRLAQALKAAGWSPREISFSGQWDAPHSTTLVHPTWPCDIDLHRFFPGFLAEDQRVFEQLWSHRTHMAVAHASIEIPDKSSTAIILALNQIRSGGSARNDSPIGRWVASQQPDERSHFVDLIVSTGSEASLVAAARAWGVALPGDRPAPDETRRRLARGMSGRHGAAAFRTAFGQASVGTRLSGVMALTLHQLRSMRRPRFVAARLRRAVTRR